MPLRHVLLAVLVSVLWGLNFMAIHASLQQFPPLFLVGLRFLADRDPHGPARAPPAGAAALAGGLRPGLRHPAVHRSSTSGWPPASRPGLASLVLQASAPFTVALGAAAAPRAHHAAAGPAASSWPWRGSRSWGCPGPGATAGGRSCWSLPAGLGWAFGNLASRQAAAPNPLHLTLWMSVVPPVPMFVLSLLVEGPEQVGDALASSFSHTAVLALARPRLHGGGRHASSAPASGSG